MPHVLIVDLKASYVQTIVDAMDVKEVQLSILTSHPIEDYPTGCDVTRVDITDLSGILEIALNIHNVSPLDGVLSFDDTGVIPASEIQKQLDIFGNTPRTALLTMDKVRMREELNAHSDFESVWFKAIKNHRDLLSLSSDRIPFPVVIKPARGEGSRAVALVESPDGFQAYLKNSDLESEEGLIVEEYIEGEEYSVETFSYGEGDGEAEHLKLATTQKITTGPAGGFVEISHICPGDMTDEVRTGLESTTLKFLEMVNATVGPAHTEIIHSRSRGSFFLIDSHIRASGDYLTWVMAKNGFDVYIESIRAIKNKKLPSFNGNSKVGGIFYFLLSDGEFMGSNLEWICEKFDIEDFELLITPGQKIDKPTSSWSRHGHLRFMSESRSAFKRKMRAVAHALEFRVLQKNGVVQRIHPILF